MSNYVPARFTSHLPDEPTWKEHVNTIFPSKLEVFKLDSTAKIPKFATQGSACFDISACFWRTISGKSKNNLEEYQFPTIDEACNMSPFSRCLIPTGLVFNIPSGYHIQINSRSGLVYKKGIYVANGTGIIDDDYTEETMVMITNNSSEPFHILNGDRIAQGRLVANLVYDIEETEIRPVAKGNRSGGFGSTGIN